MSSYESSSRDLGEQEIIRNLDVKGQLITDNLLPEKSKDWYELRYQEFTSLREKNKSDLFTENVFLVYFNELAQTYLLSTL